MHIRVPIEPARTLPALRRPGAVGPRPTVAVASAAPVARLIGLPARAAIPVAADRPERADAPAACRRATIAYRAAAAIGVELLGPDRPLDIRI